MTSSIFAALASEPTRRRSSSSPKPKVQILQGGKRHPRPTRGRVQRQTRMYRGLRKGRRWGQRPGRTVATSRVNAVVKSSFVKRIDMPRARVRRLTNYLQNRERADFEPERHFNSKDGRALDWKDVAKEVEAQFGSVMGFHTIILSPGDNAINLDHFVREVMSRWEEVLGHELNYYWVNHLNTDYYHSHVVIPGEQPDSNRNVFLDREDLADLRDICNDYLARDRMLDRLLDLQVEVGFDLRDMHYYDTEVQKEFGMSWFDYWKGQADLGQTKQQSDKEVKELGLGHLYDLGRPFHAPAREDKELSDSLYRDLPEHERRPDWDDGLDSDVFSLSHHQLRSAGVPQWSSGSFHFEPKPDRGNPELETEIDVHKERPNRRRRPDED